MQNIVLINNGTEIQVHNATCTTNAIDHLPAKVYTIKIDQRTGNIVLVSDRDKFELPSKFYGDLEENRDIIWGTYLKNTGSTGALFMGNKGMGKSILAESLCNKAIGMDIPVLYVKDSVPSWVLYVLAKNISPVVFLFDEFEKMFSGEGEQERLLTLFSDQDIKKQLFLVLANDIEKIDNHYINRPGRFMFRIRFLHIDIPTVFQIIEDKVRDPEIKLMVKLYVINNTMDLNYDTILAVINVAVASKTVGDFDKFLRIMNAPNPIGLGLTVESIVMKSGDMMECIDTIHSYWRGKDKEILTLDILVAEESEKEGDKKNKKNVKYRVASSLNLNVSDLEDKVMALILSTSNEMDIGTYNNNTSYEIIITENITISVAIKSLSNSKIRKNINTGKWVIVETMAKPFVKGWVSNSKSYSEIEEDRERMNNKGDNVPLINVNLNDMGDSVRLTPTVTFNDRVQ